MYNEINDIIKQLGLEEKYKDILRNHSLLKTNKDLLIDLINNKKYEVLSFFDRDIWDKQLEIKVQHHLKEFIRGITYMQLPEVFYDDSIILDEAIEVLEPRALRSFTKKAWTEENIIKILEKGIDSYFFHTLFDDKPLSLTIILNNKLYNYLEIVRNNDDIWTEENLDLFMSIVKEDESIQKHIKYKNARVLKKYLENRILSFQNIYWEDTLWTEENIDLLCKLYEDGLLDNYEKFIYNRAICEKLSKVILKKQLRSKYSLIQNKAWSNDNIDLFIQSLNTQEDVSIIPDRELLNNPKVLKRFLELHSEKLHNFTEDAWTDENIKLYFDTYELKEHFNLAQYMLMSEKCAKQAIRMGYIEQLKLFTFNKISEELNNLIVEAYKNYTPEKIPFYIFCKNKSLVKKLIENNLLHIVSRIDIIELWDEELVDLYCNKLEEYKGNMVYKNSYINKATPDSSKKLLHTYLKTKRFEGVNQIQQFTDAWSEENRKDLLEILDEYLKEFSLPHILHEDRNFLNYYLDKEQINELCKFNSSLYTKREIVKLVNLHHRNKINSGELYSLTSSLNDNPYCMYLKNNLVNNSLTYQNERNRFNELINNESTSSYEKFIKETNSFSIYLLINAVSFEKEKKINDLFDENGPKKELLDELLYNIDFIKYIEDKNIRLEDLTTNKIQITYIKFIKKYKLYDYIAIDDTNIDKYFDENGPKKELYEFLLNPNAVNFLYELNTDIPKLDPIYNLVCKKAIEIESDSLREKYIEFCKKNEQILTPEKLEDIYKILCRIEKSNSSEIIRFKDSLTDQIIGLENPSEKLEQLEKIFLRNNLPNLGKIFLVFKTLHPNYDGLINAYTSPTLKKANDLRRDSIILSDLIRITIGSNNRDFIEYLNNLVEGNKIYRKIKQENIDISQISDEERNLLRNFLENVEVLYNNTLRGKKESKTVETISDIDEIKRLLNPNESEEFELPDRIISMYTQAAGFYSIDEILNYQKELLERCKKHHIEISKQEKIMLKKGDLVKGIVNTKFLKNILQNGSVCKEFLGDSADSDVTPLDADVSTITDDYNNNELALSNTMAGSYGSTYLVFKNDSRFETTRTEENNSDYSLKRRNHSLELFRTSCKGSTHYGVRTGIPSCEIDYIITKENPKRICLDIALNGIYIPVVDVKGKVIFTYEDYINIRNKMKGLSYYGMEEGYTVSKEVSDDSKVVDISKQLEDSRKDIKKKQDAIYKVINSVLKKYGYKLSKTLRKNLEPGIIDCIDTGSTGRGTNIPNDCDFDFIMRLDRELLLNKEKLDHFKKDLLAAFNISSGTISTGDFRLKNVNIEGLAAPVDIDISFVVKTNGVNYSTDMCIKDRLDTIKKNNPEQYDYVIANIILAKQLLKKAECYKANRGDHPEGGLCGVGVENWILQHNGSLIDAARDFVDKAEGKSFEEFKKVFSVYNYGENFLAERRGWYVHDDYVSDNMSESGYKKMVIVLKEYIKEFEKSKIQGTIDDVSEERQDHQKHV